MKSCIDDFQKRLLFLISGLNTSLAPMYISEIAPLNLRGGLGVVNQLAVTVGLLLSQILGIEQFLGTPEGWPLLLGTNYSTNFIVHSVLLSKRIFIDVNLI
jgi:MFS family permease